MIHLQVVQTGKDAHETSPEYLHSARRIGRYYQMRVADERREVLEKVMIVEVVIVLIDVREPRYCEFLDERCADGVFREDIGVELDRIDREMTTCISESSLEQPVV